jgi:hypothetical protein
MAVTPDAIVTIRADARGLLTSVGGCRGVPVGLRRLQQPTNHRLRWSLEAFPHLLHDVNR